MSVSNRFDCCCCCYCCFCCCLYCCCHSYTSLFFVSIVDHAAREETATGTGEASVEPSAALPPSVVISSATPVGKPGSKPPTQSSTHVVSKQGSRIPSAGSSHRQSPTQEPEHTVLPKDKPAAVKPNASIFLQTANFLLEVNALQVK